MTRTAIILAGGDARRMGGRDKGEIELGGARLFDLVLERLAPQAGKIIISGTHDYGSGLEVMPDHKVGPKGPSAALLAMTKLYPNTQFLTVPVDGPFFPADIYDRLAGDTSAIASGPERDHPTFAFWETEPLAKLFASSPQTNWPLMEITEKLGARRVKFRAESYFKNFNAPDDLDITFNA